MSDRAEYNLGLSLIKEMENILKESRDLLETLRSLGIDKNKKAEAETLKESIASLRIRNDKLHMENVLLKSKVKELSMMLNSASNTSEFYKDK